MELADDLDAPLTGAPPSSAGAEHDGGAAGTAAHAGAGRGAGSGATGRAHRPRRRALATALGAAAAAVLAAGVVGLHERSAAERTAAARVSALSVQASSPRLTSDAVGGAASGGALVGVSLPLLNAGPASLEVQVLGFDAPGQRTAVPLEPVVLEPGALVTLPLDLWVRCGRQPTPRAAEAAGDPRTHVRVRLRGPGGEQRLALPTPRPLRASDSLPAQLARACAGSPAAASAGASGATGLDAMTG